MSPGCLAIGCPRLPQSTPVPLPRPRRSLQSQGACLSSHRDLHRPRRESTALPVSYARNPPPNTASQEPVHLHSSMPRRFHNKSAHRPPFFHPSRLTTSDRACVSNVLCAKP